MFKMFVPLLAVLLPCVALCPLRGDEAPRPARRATIGILIEPMAPQGGESGVVVRDVAPDGPAAKAGLQKGDVIVKADDKDVKDFEALAAIVAKHKPGDKLNFEISRKGKKQQITVALVERRSPPRIGRVFPDDKPTAFLGVQAEELTPDLKNRVGITAEKGVIVEDIVPGSPAAKAGLKREDIIISVNGKTILNPGQLREAIREAGVGKKVTINAFRGREKKELVAELEEAPGDLAFPIPRIRIQPSGGTAVPIPLFEDRGGRVEQLERHIKELENRVRDLEQKVNQQKK